MPTESPRSDTNRSPASGVSRWTKLALIGGGIAAALIAGITIAQNRAAHHQVPFSQRLASSARPLDLTFTADGWLSIEWLVNFEEYTPAQSGQILQAIDKHWRPGYMPILMELSRYSRDRFALGNLVRKHAGLQPTAGSNSVWHTIWKQDDPPHPNYAAFKSQLYRGIDRRFANYFSDDRPTTIRLDEVRWGGVRRDGIPPLKNPQMLAASDARYLSDSNVVFGIEINGDARAYPKRILAWHEMFKDTVGGVSLCGVYCTLCGMMIPYETEFDGVDHELGTSGFLYRSNKLMYDHATESMWSTTKGVPVIGPLVGKGIKLKTHPVVTTTWGKWRERHPETTVLSLNTGHHRDYGEGVAYQNYFSTDRLMFTVPELATNTQSPQPIANKLEVLALRFGGEPAPPTAISTQLLAQQPVYHGEYGGVPYVVVTNEAGANRVYETGGHRFKQLSADEQSLTDEAGGKWSISEKQLSGENGTTLQRLSTHRAFWFGWQAAHPDTKLIGG